MGISEIDAWVSSIDSVNKLVVDDVRQLPNEDLLIAATVDLSSTVQVSGDEDTYYSDEGYRAFWEDGPPGSYVTARFPASSTILFTIILDGNTKEVLSSEIDSEYGNFPERQHPFRND